MSHRNNYFTDYLFILDNHHANFIIQVLISNFLDLVFFLNHNIF